MLGWARSADAERGQQTYYKYMVHGDDKAPPHYGYAELIKKRGSMLGFVGGARSAGAAGAAGSAGPAAARPPPPHSADAAANGAAAGGEAVAGLRAGAGEAVVAETRLHQLREILGESIEDGRLVGLLERAGGSVDKAVRAHFDGAAPAAAAAAAGSAGRLAVETHMAKAVS